jgi:hypothetical protein
MNRVVTKFNNNCQGFWRKYRWLIIIFVICGTEVFANGPSHYNIKLVNGYRVVKINADEIFIFPPDSVHFSVYDGHWAVPPKVTGINLLNEIVFGKIERSSNAYPGPQGQPGFFILDTKNHKVKLGMDKENWQRELKSFGISGELLLKKPSQLFTVSILEIAISVILNAAIVIISCVIPFRYVLRTGNIFRGFFLSWGLAVLSYFLVSVPIFGIIHAFDRYLAERSVPDAIGNMPVILFGWFPAIIVSSVAMAVRQIFFSSPSKDEKDDKD